MLSLPIGSTLHTPCPMYDPNLLFESIDSLEPAVVRASESVVSDLFKHVKQFTEIREFVQTIQSKSRLDKVNLVSRELQTFAEYADYAQNLDMPHFGLEQPGYTYYFSPLGIYIFGIVKASETCSQLRCFN